MIPILIQLIYVSVVLFCIEIITDSEDFRYLHCMQTSFTGLNISVSQIAIDLLGCHILSRHLMISKKHIMTQIGESFVFSSSCMFNDGYKRTSCLNRMFGSVSPY